MQIAAFGAGKSMFRAEGNIETDKCRLVGGEGGIRDMHPKKFSAAMVKPNFFRVNEQIVEKPFCQCHWEI
jgi:hypothetical protein